MSIDRDTTSTGEQVVAPPSSSSRRERAARLLTGVFGAATVLAALLWLLTRWDTRQAGWVELIFATVNVPLSGSLVSIAVLALITRALLGRKLIGLVGVAAFQVLGLYVGLTAVTGASPAPLLSQWSLRGGTLTRAWEIVSMLAALAILAGLWWVRSAFPGHLQQGSWLRLAAVLAAGLAATVTVTWLLLYLADTGHAPHPRQLVSTVARAFGDVDADTDRELAGVAPWIPQVTSLLVSVTLLGAVVVFLRSATRGTVWSVDREVQLRRLLQLHGHRDSLGYFATRRDKSSVFAADLDAAIAYRVAGGVSLASGDPVGDPKAWPAAIGAWKAEARFYGWLPAVLSASEAGARAYAAAGLAVVGLGDEAILSVDRFTLNSTTRSDVRHAVGRARRAGLTISIRRQHQIPGGELAQLVSLMLDWRSGAIERGFRWR